MLVILSLGTCLSGGISSVAICSSTLMVTSSSLCCGALRTCRVNAWVTASDLRWDSASRRTSLLEEFVDSDAGCSGRCCILRRHWCSVYVFACIMINCSWLTLSIYQLMLSIYHWCSVYITDAQYISTDAQYIIIYWSCLMLNIDLLTLTDAQYISTDTDWYAQLLRNYYNQLRDPQYIPMWFYL